jgi:hypothetical protein
MAMKISQTTLFNDLESFETKLSNTLMCFKLSFSDVFQCSDMFMFHENHASSSCGYTISESKWY